MVFIPLLEQVESLVTEVMLLLCLSAKLPLKFEILVCVKI